MNVKRVKFIAPLILVVVVIGGLLVACPQCLSSFISASADGEVSKTAPAGDVAQSEPGNTKAGGIRKIRTSPAEGRNSDGNASGAIYAERQRPSNSTSSSEISPRGPGPTQGRLRVPPGNASWTKVLGCAIEPDKTAEIGSPVVGVVSSIISERGDRVERDQELARLRANVQQASVAVAQARTQADAEVRAAQTNVDFLRQKLARAEGLVELNFISEQALEESRTDTRLAEERLAQAREQQRVWQKELNLANAQLQMRTIRAPFDGIIVDRFVSVGERIEDEPLFRIVKTDPLRVEIVAPSSMFGMVSAGTVVKVMPELPNAPALLAEVDLVDTVIDGASNTFRVRATLSNPDGALPSGLRCRAEVTDLPVQVADLPTAEPSTAVPAKEPATLERRQGLKVDTNLASLQRATTNAAIQGKRLAPHTR
jgi:RND family efflux transporter MFP subunit